MSMPVTVYTKTVCPQCIATKRRLDTLGVPYTEINIEHDEKAYKRVVEMGFSAAPVVVAGDDAWSGFRHERLGALAKDASANAA